MQSEVGQMSWMYLAGHWSFMKQMINDLQDKNCAEYRTGWAVVSCIDAGNSGSPSQTSSGLKTEVIKCPTNCLSFFTLILGISSQQTSAAAWQYSYIVLPAIL